MPVLIGLGTSSASVIIGKRRDPVQACVAVMIAVVFSIALMLMLNSLHDFARPRKGRLIDRYTEIDGRIAAIYVGAVAIDMIMQGVRIWANMV